MWSIIAMTLLGIVGVMMIILILLQRGRGGGLAGAFGGAGGQSAFGTKAGDVFTRITVVFAVIWVALAGMNILILRNQAKNGPFGGGANAVADEPSVSPKETEGGTSSDAGKTDSPEGSSDDDLGLPALPEPASPKKEEKTDTPKSSAESSEEASSSTSEENAEEDKPTENDSKDNQ